VRLYSMAIRNLGRSRRRTILTALSVCIAMLMVMFLDGFVGGFVQNLVTNFTKDEVGHVKVETAAYRARERFMPVSEYMRDSARIAEAIEGIPGLKGEVRTVAERIRFGVLLDSGTGTKSALCIAGDPAVEKGLLMLDRSIKSGSYIAAPGEAIIGAGIAKDLGFKVGDTLKVVTEKADYGLGFKRFKVAGVFATNVNALDGSIFQIGLDDARDLLGAEGGATQLIVMLASYRDSDAAAKTIQAGLEKAGFAGLAVVPWTKSGSFANLMILMDRMFAWINIIIAFLGAFVIANVMMMVVLERKREIGILKSMGMPKREILYLFLLEGCLLGAIGSAAGVLLGLALCVLFSKVGMDFSSAMASFTWPMDNIVYTTVSLPDAFLLFLLGVVVAAVISFLPSRKAAMMDPIEAIRSV
jgi:putative ABC transport system permease protein